MPWLFKTKCRQQHNIKKINNVSDKCSLTAKETCLKKQKQKKPNTPKKHYQQNPPICPPPQIIILLVNFKKTSHLMKMPKNIKIISLS